MENKKYKIPTQIYYLTEKIRALEKGQEIKYFNDIKLLTSWWTDNYGINIWNLTLEDLEDNFEPIINKETLITIINQSLDYDNFRKSILENFNTENEEDFNEELHFFFDNLRKSLIENKYKFIDYI